MTPQRTPLLLRILSILLATSGPALAYEPTSGTGAVPSPVDWTQFAGTQPDLAEAVKATDTGDASYSYAIGLPPAVLSPALSLSYGSSGGLDRELPFGWSLSGPLKIVRPVSREFIHGELRLSGELSAVAVSPGSVPAGNRDMRASIEASTAANCVRVRTACFRRAARLLAS